MEILSLTGITVCVLGRYAGDCYKHLLPFKPPSSPQCISSAFSTATHTQCTHRRYNCGISSALCSAWEPVQSLFLSIFASFLVNSTLSLFQKCVFMICSLLLPHQKADTVCAITCNTHNRWNQLERRHGDSAVLRLFHHPVLPLQNLLHSLYRNFSFTLTFFFLY